ncbi:MAG TPA: NADP-dependent oxidoreductase [Candidatus Acidoferrum sp.]|nr:NADP-dependent oxidoreductase [Candidatus Acidoferrum sp.]
MGSALPETMKAAVLDGAGPPEAFQIKQVPLPHLTRNHVIIALDYASVGSWDAKLRQGAWGEVKPGTILGADGSGTIAAVASGVERLRVGDRVYSYSYDNPHGGFYAEYVSVPADRVEHVPRQIDQKVAGAMPCVALTAQSGWEALEIRRGQTVLVFGASGGVGSMAVWLASNPIDATVVGAARTDAHEYVRKLGAAHAVDPHSGQREAVLKRVAPQGFDAALVTADGDTLPAFLTHLRAGAAFAYPNGVEPEPHLEGHRGIAFDAQMSRAAFERLNLAIGSRAIPLRVEVFSLDEVSAAHRRIEQGRVLGKLVLQIRD